MPRLSDDPAERAAAVAAGLRELAGWIVEHPDVPLSQWGVGIGFAVDAGDDDEGRVLVGEIAAALGVPVEETEHHILCRRHFGGVSFDASHVFSEGTHRSVCEDAVEPERSAA